MVTPNRAKRPPLDIPSRTAMVANDCVVVCCLDISNQISGVASNISSCGCWLLTSLVPTGWTAAQLHFLNSKGPQRGELFSVDEWI